MNAINIKLHDLISVKQIESHKLRNIFLSRYYSFTKNSSASLYFCLTPTLMHFLHVFLRFPVTWTEREQRDREGARVSDENCVWNENLKADKVSPVFLCESFDICWKKTFHRTQSNFRTHWQNEIVSCFFIQQNNSQKKEFAMILWIIFSAYNVEKRNEWHIYKKIIFNVIFLDNKTFNISFLRKFPQQTQLFILRRYFVFLERVS